MAEYEVSRNPKHKNQLTNILYFSSTTKLCMTALVAKYIRETKVHIQFPNLNLVEKIGSRT